ncbi:MAG: hypothetical protein Kow0099_01170 [Candidatus Abyssubacteria bacterium]
MTAHATGAAVGCGSGKEESPRASLLTAGCVLLFAFASVFVFRGVWNPANTIYGTDSSLWVPMFVQNWTRWLFVPRWFPHFLAGIPQQFEFLSQSLPTMLLLPPHRFHGFQFMLDTFLAGTFMFVLLRDRKMGRFGALVGGFSFQLGNGLLTSARQGVLWVFDTACWVPLFLMFFIRVLDNEPRRTGNMLLAGAFLGLQFLGGEVQLAYYVCLLAAAYFCWDAAHRLVFSRSLSEELAALGRRFGWAALTAAVGIVFAAEVFCSYYSYSERHTNVGVRTEDENWRFATQFSFSPRETPALMFTASILDGDSAQDWPADRRARFSDNYLGILVLMFAFLGLLSSGRRRYFFGCAGVAALVISFGRHFPQAYRVVYALPLMHEFRNPHKWLFITGLCVSILAGMGADYWRTGAPSHNRKIVIGTTAFCGGVVAIGYLTPLITSSAYAKTISYINFRVALVAVGALVLVIGRFRRRVSRTYFIIPSVAAGLLAADLIGNASSYISYYDYRELFTEDETVKWLQSKPGPYRVKLWSETPYLRYLATEVFPYAGIDTVDAIMSRRPGRYSEIFEAARIGRLPYEKLFHLFNVKYILSSTRLPSDIRASLAAVLTPSGSSGEIYVYELLDALPRVYLVTDLKTAKAEDIIGLMSQPEFDLSRTALLESKPQDVIETDGMPVWTIERFTHSPHRVSFQVSVDRDAMLVLQDFADEDWHASIDGEETPVLNANYLMRGILVPEGVHMILFRYRPAVWGFFVTLAGWLLLVCAVGYGCAMRLLQYFKGSSSDEA